MNTEILKDIIDGYPVISQLNVDDLKSGKHTFWFRVSTNALGQWHHLPVIVFKGHKAGKRFVITAGVHGDEYNGMLASHQIANALSDLKISGSVVIVPTVNLSGTLNHNRDYISNDPDHSTANLNRFFPGDEQGNEAQRYVYHVWEHLLKPNADLAIDLHTQTTGTTYPLYAFADYRLPDCIKMARLIGPDVILNDPGDPGILETVWNRNGIPSTTLEIGMGRYSDYPLVERAVSGVLNVLTDYGVMESHGASINTNIYEGKDVVSIRALTGGFYQPQVSLLQSVKEGDLLSIGQDIFGAEVRRYYAPRDGVVLSLNVEPMRATGALIVRLIY
ncbi:succinylglutamate desuccinylase/aspartoacylase family protein [Vibrio gallicus]|uniref:succinylglutamate desuccinylase/aspartoacylase family protein n=1 Tax=Vibrio gallicus TaxID=190897 RepID=UPI0021C49366|nr:succinylglutamate desuccinylase/aspartoacylase family protein [Vibrio gallicus]